MAFDFHARPYLSELLREDRWNVLTVLIFHSNADNRCWPSGEKIHDITGKSQTTITRAKQWLIQHGAIRLVPNTERTEKEKNLPRRQHIYQLTGILDLNGEKIPYFFQPEIKLVNPSEDKSNPTNVEIPQTGNSTDWKFHTAETKYSPEELIPEVIPNNTDVSNDTSMRPDQTPQNYDMVSDHVADDGKMVTPESQSDGDLVETHGEPPSKVPAKVPPVIPNNGVGRALENGITMPSPREYQAPTEGELSSTSRKVNKSGATVIRARDPLFDSVARLQFGIDDTADMPKGFGARITRIVTVMVDAYKQRNNVTALSPDERLGLAGIHAKFWQWYTTVKYPARGNQTPKELKSDVKFGEYWMEYRAYKSTQQARPDYSAAADWRYQDDPTD